MVEHNEERGDVARLTTEIVSAYVAHNPVATSDLARLIEAVGGQLRTVGREEVAPTILHVRFAFDVAAGRQLADAPE